MNLSNPESFFSASNPSEWNERITSRQNQPNPHQTNRNDQDKAAHHTPYLSTKHHSVTYRKHNVTHPTESDRLYSSNQPRYIQRILIVGVTDNQNNPHPPMTL